MFNKPLLKSSSFTLGKAASPMTDPEFTLGRKSIGGLSLWTQHHSKGVEDWNTLLVFPIPLILNHWLNPWTLFFHHRNQEWTKHCSLSLEEKGTNIYCFRSQVATHQNPLELKNTKKPGHSPRAPHYQIRILFGGSGPLFFFKEIHMGFVENYWFIDSLLHTKNFATYFIVFYLFHDWIQTGSITEPMWWTKESRSSPRGDSKSLPFQCADPQFLPILMSYFSPCCSLYWTLYLTPPD